MLRTIPLALAALSLGVGAGFAQMAAASHSDETIAARKGLMNQAEFNLYQLEAAVAGATVPDLVPLAEKAVNIGALMRAVPHLFPYDTNYKATPDVVRGVETSASPKIWQDSEAFFAEASSVALFAEELGAMTDPVAFKPAVATLRNACESCHANWLEYDPFAAFGGEAAEPAAQ